MDQRQQLEQAIAAQEALRGTLSDEVIEATIGALRDKLAALESADPQQQRKLATILFADVAGFTAMSETLDPEIVTGIMNDLWARLDAAIVDQGGHIDKHIGDAVMALWGTDAAREDDAEQAIRAALAMQEALTSFHAAKDDAGEVMQLSMRIGINTGPVLLGQVGSTREFTAMGDAVNLASRLEHAAPAGGILISYDTYCHVRGLFDVQALEPIQVKGKVEPVQVYVVRAARPRSFRKTTRGVEGVQTRMIGREKELLALQHAFQDVFEGFETRVETVIGEAGVGKSRLLYEFDNWLNCQPQQFALLKGRVNAAEENLTRALFRDIFSNHFGIRDVDSKAVVQEKFHMGTTGILELDQADVLGHWLGFDFSGSKAVRSLLGSPVLGTQARSHLMDYMEALAVTAPLLILLEDLHWADDASLDLVEDLARTIGDAHPGQARLLIIGLARPGLFRRRPNWGKELAIFGRILLAPLSRRASGALVNEILQRVDNVPDSLRDFVVDAAEGNPFYVEELIKMFIERGVIETEPSWRVLPERLAETEVPATLTSLLQARLDSLRRPERETIQQAAVIGRLFWDTAVCSLAAAEVQDIWPLLDEIRRREMIFQRDQSSFAGADEYIFKHALLRDVAYETVLLKARRTYHCRAAEWLEAHAGERRKEYLNQIAAHYLLADEGEKALPYLLQAGDQARLLYATEEAVDHYERALAILKERGEKEEMARLLMKLGLTHSNAFNFEEAQKAYDESFALQQQGSAIVHRPQEKDKGLGRPAEKQRTEPDLPPAPHAFRVGVQILGNAPTVGAYPGLVKLSVDLDVVPDVAWSWEIHDAGCTYLFHLRDDVYWSDGQQVTANDFNFAWRKALDPDHGSQDAEQLYDIIDAIDYHQGSSGSDQRLGIEVLDDHTLRVKLVQPAAHFLQLLTTMVARAEPQHVFETSGDNKAFNEQMISCSPFQPLLQNEDSIFYRRYTRYHGQFTGNVESVELRFGSSQDYLKLYEEGELDAVNISTLASKDFDRALQEYASDYKTGPAFYTEGLKFNLDSPPFGDSRLRRAFVLATNRERLAAEYRKGRDHAATGGFVPPGMPGHVPGIGLPFDPQQAQSLLAEAGYPGGRNLPTLKAILAPWQSWLPGLLFPQWQEILGANVSWTIYPSEAFSFDTYREHVQKEQPHILYLVWKADYADPDDFLRVGLRWNSSWQHERYGALIEQAKVTMDQAKRLDLFRQAEEILVQEAPFLQLLYPNEHLIVKPWIKNYHPRTIPNWHHVIIEPHEEEKIKEEKPIPVPELQHQNVLRLPILEGDLGPGFDPRELGTEDYGLFPGLVQLSRELDVVPDTARYWEILDNGRRYRFHLRDDVFWSDGKRVTAADFIYAWHRMLDPQVGAEFASLLYDIAGAADYHRGRGSKEDVGIKALDERTLEIKLKHPTAYFMQLLCHHIASAVPRHVVERFGPRWADVDHLVTCGPFRLQSLDEKSLVLRRDPTYHGRFEGNVEGIEYRFYPNFELQLADYNACRLDTLGWVPPSMRESPHFSPELWENFNSYPGLRVAAIIFDVNQWPFDDPRVRRAFVLATDRRRVAGEEEYGRGTAVTGGFVPPSIPGHVPDIALPFDPAAAGRLLAEAGFPGGVGMPVVRVIMQPYNQQEEVERVLEPWQDFLGVEIEWQAIPYEDILTQITRQQPHINFSAWEADYPDPDSFLRVAVREMTVWHDEAYDALVEEARTSLDHNRRRELFRQAEEILAREAPLMPLLYLNDHRFVRPWIKNYQHHVNFKPHWHKVTIERH